MTCTDCMVQLASFMVSLVDESGPITIDTKVVYHNWHLKNELGIEKAKKLEEEGIFTIGKPNSKITKIEIITTLQLMKEYLKKADFDNSRSYWFEGIYKKNMNNYYFRWGS